MSKKKLRDELDKIPEKKQSKPKKKDRIAELAAEIKKKYGIDVEPVKGNAKYKRQRVYEYLSSKYDFRYNVINTDTEYKLKDSKQWLYLDDADYRTIWDDLDKVNLSFPKSKFDNLVYGKELPAQFNPFRNYFNNIPKWDGETDYINDYLSQVSLSSEEHREYFQKGFKKWFVALIVSLLEDEPSLYKINQTCLVLVGAQGKYKTTWLKNIIPKHLQLKYFYGGSFQVHNKDHEKYLAYKIIINLDEMAAYYKADIESVKSKITQDQIVVRLPYAKADIHLKRRASFTATQNNLEFLKDDTGSRRWFVIQIDDIAIDDSFDIDMMYAQGYAMYKKGHQYWFDRDDILKIELHNEPHHLKNFEYELVEKYYAVPSDDDFKESNTFIDYVSATDIAIWLANETNKINVNNTVIKNIGGALKKLGFYKVSRRREGYKTPIPLWCVMKVFQPKSYSENGKTNEDSVF